ncbi:MAG: sulfotransferase [Myxococcota bacterium]
MSEPTIDRILQHLEKGQSGEAYALQSTVVLAREEDSAQLASLGRAWRGRGYTPLALPIFNRVLDLCPEQAEAWANVAWCLMDLGQHPLAEESFRRALERDPDHPSSLFGMYGALLSRGDVQTALQKLVRARELSGGAPAVLAALAKHHLTALNLDAAEAAARELAHKEPSAGHMLLCRVAFRRKDYETAMDHVERSLADRPEWYQAWFWKADVLHAQAKYPEAAKAYVRANHLAPRKGLVTLEGFSKDAEALRKHVASMLERAPTPVDPQQPVFVVGSPRSGTSILTQALDNHSGLYSVGESQLVPSLAQVGIARLGGEAGVIELLRALGTQSELQDELRDRARVWIETHAPAGARIVDKLPGNVFSLGLIAHVFPGAAVVQMVRDGRDVAFSAFSICFEQALWHSYAIDDALLEWSHALELGHALADRYGVPYRRQRYEAFTRAPREELEAILGFLGLPFEDRCLEVADNRRFVATASYAQVRDGIHSRSVAKWRHYAQLFEEIPEHAQRALTELGYT